VHPSPPQLPATPCPIEPALLDDMPYRPEVFMLDELLELDPERSLVRVAMGTDAGQPLTAAQRADPVRHPQHVAGGLILQATSVVGFIHGYYLLGLRHADGWVGFGTHIHKAVFRRLIAPGADVVMTCRATRLGLGDRRHMIRYTFELLCEGERCYEGDQSAMWVRLGEDAAAAELPDLTGGPRP
jgi:hypothetical protein